MARKSIRTWRKERMYLKELTDSEIIEFKKSSKYNADEAFGNALDAEYRYRFESKIK
jgi:hypothetical protein